MPDQLRLIVILMSAVLVAVGMAVAGKFVGDGFRLAAGSRFIAVEGTAERMVEADLAVWAVRVTATGSELGAVQARVDQSVDALTVFLVGEGLAKEALERGPVDVDDLLARRERPDDAGQSRYIISQTVTVRTADVTKLHAAAARSGELVRLGVVFAGGGPRYAFTAHDAIKPELVTMAVQAARASAERLAGQGGGQLGGVRSAVETTVVDDDAEGQSIQKRIRVIAAVEFDLVQ